MKKKINLINLQIDGKIKKKFNNYKLKNLISIGDWCELPNNIYLKKKKFKHLDFYNWYNLKKKSKDAAVIINTYEYFLKFLTKKLNKIHKENRSVRFWEMLLSRWLFTYVVNIFSRWQIVNKIKLKYEINSVLSKKIETRNLIPYTSKHFHWIMQSPYDDDWNTLIFNKIIKFIFKNQIKFITFENKKKINNKNNIFKKVSYSNVINLSAYKKIFFYDFSLDRKLKLLMMFENLFLNIQLKKKNLNLDNIINDFMREKLNLEKNISKNYFHKFIHLDLKNSLPKIFLEDYSLLKKTYKNLNWPKKPEYILSSYGQYYDEVFKFYCAQKVDNTKFFILQHGYNNIFADKDFYSGNIDKKISTNFLTWGKNLKDNSKPFIFPLKSHFEAKINSNKKIIFILYAFNEKPYLPLNGFISNNKKNVKTIKLVEKFIKNSSLEIQNNSSAKLMSHSIIESVNKSIKYKFPNIVFVNPKKKFSQIINNFNLSIHFFLGTPFFESMHHNKPCILILDKEMHLNFDKKFSIFLKDLKKNKICFEKADEASRFITLNYDNISKWWKNKSLQKSRNEFCEVYCRNFKNDNKILKKIF